MKKRGKQKSKTHRADKVDKTDKSNKSGIFLLLRYVLAVLFGVFLSLFYKTFLPLTIWPVYFLLKIFYNPIISGNLITISNFSIEIIGACVAGSAYFLLLILNLTTTMKIKKRIKSIIFSFSLLLFLNILRIFLLSVMYLEGSVFFDFTHKLFWYFLSIIFVVAIWFLTTWIFKIKEIPVYSDLKFLIRNIKTN